MPRVNTFFMDQISEHQRDLSNSASQRFIADYVAGFCLAVSRMAGVIEGLGADRQRLMANLRGDTSGIPGGILAEPAYILLAESGVSDAHEVIRKITLNAEKEKVSFAQALAKEPDVVQRIGGKMAELGLIASPNETLSFFEKPERYNGLAAKKAKQLAQKYQHIFEGK
jgi:adenylosuccinate lyase